MHAKESGYLVAIREPLKVFELKSDMINWSFNKYLLKENGGYQRLGGWGKRGDIGERVQTFSYKMNKF